MALEESFNLWHILLVMIVGVGFGWFISREEKEQNVEEIVEEINEIEGDEDGKSNNLS